ncbi:MAG: class I SAM-dependent methyltransferase [Bacteroidaceae bacterium]|nr:class I SAM-dependent methyltransferase [Bacteroidaceae bacterium]
MSIDDYILSHISPEGDYLYRLYRATNVHLLRGRMASGHLQGRLLKMIVEMTQARNILEVGTFSGYSAICLAEGLAANLRACGKGREGDDGSFGTVVPNTVAREAEEGREGIEGREGGKVVTFEINDEMEPFTRPWIEGSHVAEYIDFRIGDAVTEAPKLGVKFDLVFIDGDKRTYIDIYNMALDVTRDGGFILADNTLWDGHVVEDIAPADRQTRGIVDFNDYVHRDSRVETVILPLRDGLTLIKKR